MKLIDIKNLKPEAFIGLLGGILLLRWALLSTPLYYYDISTIVRIISSIVSGLWSCIAIIFSVRILKGNKRAYKYLIISGIGGIISTFIPIFFYNGGYGTIFIYFLSGTSNYTDLILILLGGILGFAFNEERE